jgi:hypothetical protein
METIILRGHHLRVLYRHYVWGISLEVIRAKLTEKYNEEQAVKVVKILSDIVEGNAQITFTDDLDDICSREDCPMYDHTCEWSNFNSADDKRYLRKFGFFSMKKQYSSEEVLRRLKENDYLKWLKI